VSPLSGVMPTVFHRGLFIVSASRVHRRRAPSSPRGRPRPSLLQPHPRSLLPSPGLSSSTTAGAAQNIASKVSSCCARLRRRQTLQVRRQALRLLDLNPDGPLFLTFLIAMRAWRSLLGGALLLPNLFTFFPVCSELCPRCPSRRPASVLDPASHFIRARAAHMIASLWSLRALRAPL
jgi:hypothetical protein